MNRQRIKGSVLCGSLVALLLLIAGLANMLPVPTAQPLVAASVKSSNSPLQPPLTSTCGTFYDVDQFAYFYQGVVFLNCRNVVNGYPCNTNPNAPCQPPDNLPWYLPYENVTRGQLAKIVSEGYGYNDQIPPTLQTYEDVPPNSTFWVYVQRIATYRNIMTGYPCGGVNEPCIAPNNRPYFRWQVDADRNTIAKAAVVAAGYSLLNPPTPTFIDVPSTSQFYTYIESAYAQHILDGYSCGTSCLEFRPTEKTKRGQVAKIVANTRLYIQYESFPAHIYPNPGSNNFDYGFLSPLAYGLRTIPSGLLNAHTVGYRQYRVELKDMMYTLAAKQYIMNANHTKYWFDARYALSSLSCVSGQYTSGFTSIPGVFLGPYLCGGAPELEIAFPAAIDPTYKYSIQFTLTDSSQYIDWASVRFWSSIEVNQDYTRDYMAEICYKNSISGVTRCPDPFPAHSR